MENICCQVEEPKLGEKIVYKVVCKWQDWYNETWHTVTNSRKSICAPDSSAVTYSLNEWTACEHSVGPLFAFETEQQAVDFAKQFEIAYDTEVYRATAVAVRPLNVEELPFKDTLVSALVEDFPPGTVLCNEIRLDECVYGDGLDKK